MKEFEAKTVADAVNKAADELKVPAEKIKYEVLSEVKGLFKKSAKIGVYEAEDAKDYAVKYLQNILDAMGLKADIDIKDIDGIIHLDMSSDTDANRIIGRGGETLKALNELVRACLFNKFNEHYRILLNINGYKDQKYEKLIAMAKRIASSVARTRITAELNPMTSDERRAIHNALADDAHIKTISVGTGNDRHITIQYVNSNGDAPAASEPKKEESIVPNKEADIDQAFAQKEEEISSKPEEDKKD